MSASDAAETKSKSKNRASGGKDGRDNNKGTLAELFRIVR